MIYQNIRSIRMLKNFTQAYMAERLDISPKSYGKLENGKTGITIRRLEQLALILQIEPGDLLTFDEAVRLIPAPSGQKQEAGADQTISMKEINLYERLLIEKDESIQRLRSEIDYLKAEIVRIREASF